MGILIGHLPIFGITTILAILIGALFRLNQPVLQVTNQMMTVTHLIMIPVFLRFGEWVVGAPPMPLNPKVVIAEFFNDIPLFFHKFGMAGVHAFLGWLIVAPFAGILVYRSSLYFIRKMKNQSNIKV